MGQIKRPQPRKRGPMNSTDAGSMPEVADRAKRAPSTARVSPREKAREHLALLRDKAGQLRAAPDFGWVFEDLAEYDALLQRHRGRRLAEARVLEIGYGARPYRLLAMLAEGIDASGVDAEVPLLDGSPAEFAAILRDNGAERLAKSLVRHVLFDRRERRALARELAARGATLRTPRERFEVADAAELRRAPGSVDLIVSEDVFEHIGKDSLRRLVPAMASWLSPGGLALIRPNVFTGITGGHLVEWNRRSFAVGRERRSEPWEHLRADRMKPNTHLNRLTRAQYRELFEPQFEILEEIVKLPDLGREFLTGTAAQELSGWSEEELFSNQVMFVLRPRA